MTEDWTALYAAAALSSRLLGIAPRHELGLRLEGSRYDAGHVLVQPPPHHRPHQLRHHRLQRLDLRPRDIGGPSSPRIARREAEDRAGSHAAGAVRRLWRRIDAPRHLAIGWAVAV